MIQPAGEIPQEGQGYFRALVHQAVKVFAGDGVQGDGDEGLDSGVVDAVGFEGRHRVEGLAWSQPHQHLFAASGGETVDAHLPLRDEVGRLAGVALNDNGLTGSVGVADGHVGNTSQRIVGEAGEEGDAAQGLGNGLHHSIIVAENAIASRRVWPQDEPTVPRISPTGAGRGGARGAADGVHLRGSRCWLIIQAGYPQAVGPTDCQATGSVSASRRGVT